MRTAPGMNHWALHPGLPTRKKLLMHQLGDWPEQIVQVAGSGGAHCTVACRLRRHFGGEEY